MGLGSSSQQTASQHAFSQQMEEYLEAMGRLEEQASPLTTSALARECRVAAPSVTQMLQRLSELGLVDYVPRGRFTLTPLGRRAAASVMRRHRLWERFLHDVLGIRWDSVHDEACRLEHATSEHVEQHLAETLSQYDTCPHGHPIPAAGAEVQPEELVVPLSLLCPGQRARVDRVLDESGAVLRALEKLGLTPGAVVRREEIDGVRGDGQLSLVIGDLSRVVDASLAKQLLVCPLPEHQTGADLDVSSTLDCLDAGETGKVEGVRGSRGFVGRCLALGFTPGAKITVVQNCHSGPLITQVRDVRVALGRSEAQKIAVVRGR